MIFTLLFFIHIFISFVLNLSYIDHYIYSWNVFFLVRSQIMNYLSAGYFLLLPTSRKEYLDRTVVPESILSVSECICTHYPDTSILWGDSEEKKRYIEQPGLSLNTFQFLKQWNVKCRYRDDICIRSTLSRIVPSIGLSVT